jgi:hypothetical protein
MFKDTDKNYIILTVSFFILTAAYLISEYVITGNKFGVPLDDVWIHFRFAENFAKGHFFEYNIGQPVPGTTSPLWVIILSIPFIFSSKLILTFALILSSILFLITIIQLYKLAIEIGFDTKTALLISIVTLLCGRLLWSSLSGMEISLFCLLCVLIFRNHLREQKQTEIFITTGLLLGLAANTRPEAYLLAVIYYTVSVILLKKQFNENIGKLILSLLVFILLILPYPVFSYVHTGSILPSTFKGQGGELRYVPQITFLVESGKLFVKDNLIILLLWFIGIIYFIYILVKKNIDRNLLLMNLWIIVLPAVSSVLTPNWRHHGRYLIPLIPFINIISINILIKIFGRFRGKDHEFQRKLKAFASAGIILFSIPGTILYCWSVGWNVENINSQQVNIAGWLNNNLPDEKAFATNDIGAITFITGKTVIDMAGLVTPEIFDYQKLSYEEGAKNLFKFIKEKNVNYMIIYPDWYPYIIENYSYALQEVFSARLRKNTICGGIEMFVYKINWDKINQGL